MASQDVNLGTAPTGAGGDTVREGFTKVNANFAEHDSRLDDLETQTPEAISGEAQTREQADTALGGRIDSTQNIYIPDMHRRAVETATGGHCTVIYTAKGQPSYFHVIPKFNCEDLAPGGELGAGVHPAFKFGNDEPAEIFIGMYEMAEVNGEGVSQPMMPPKVSISWTASRSLIQACGTGFDMMTIWDWAAVVLWSAANGFDVRGNTNYGRHHNNRWETGRRQDELAPGDTGGAALGNILTGSGPNAWRHNNAPDGIADMVGNVWEWLLGSKTIDGRVYLAPDNDIGAESTWLDTGFDPVAINPWSSMDTTGANIALKQALIAPNGALDPDGRFYINTDSERFPIRGGARNYGSYSGAAALAFISARTNVGANVGSRPRFRNL